jgi:hypothetical protein
MFFYATADSGLTAEEAAREKAKAAAGAAIPNGAAMAGCLPYHAMLLPSAADLAVVSYCAYCAVLYCAVQAIVKSPTQTRQPRRCTSTCWLSLL